MGVNAFMNQNISGQLSLEEQLPDIEDKFAVIEACLFAAGHPLTYERLSLALGVSESYCRDLVEKLATVYNTDVPFPRGIILVRYPDSCQLCTRERYGEEIKLALGIRRGGALSQSLLEVLAIIAYNQPTTRAYVDAVRGVDSGYAVNALIEKKMIEQCGRLDTPGRPSLYRTTEDFLRVFGISSPAELPSVFIKNDKGESVEIAPSMSSPEVPSGGEE